MTKYLNENNNKKLTLNMFKRSLLLFFFVIIALQTVHATDVEIEYTFKMAPTISIERPCFSDTGWCTGAAVCNLKVTDPDNNIIVQNGVMTNQVSFHNLSVSNISKTGIYKADMVCTDNGVSGFNSFFFAVNDAGFDYRQNGGVGFILGTVILLMVLFGIASFYMNDGLRLAFLTLTFLMLPVSLWIALNIVRNSFMGSTFVSLLTWAYGASLVGFFGMVLYVLFTLTMALRLKKNPEQPELGKGYGHSSYVSKRNSREED
jgi:hypothetical protein